MSDTNQKREKMSDSWGDRLQFDYFDGGGDVAFRVLIGDPLEGLDEGETPETRISCTIMSDAESIADLKRLHDILGAAIEKAKTGRGNV